MCIFYTGVTAAVVLASATLQMYIRTRGQCRHAVRETNYAGALDMYGWSSSGIKNVSLCLTNNSDKLSSGILLL